VTRLRHERKQSFTAERRIGAEAPACTEALLGGRAQEVERERDTRPSARDVVLQIAEEPLVPKVELRAESEEDDVEVERIQVEHAGKPLPYRIRRTVDCDGEERLTRRTSERPLDVCVADDEATMGVGAGRRSVNLARALDGSGECGVEAA